MTYGATANWRRAGEAINDIARLLTLIGGGVVAIVGLHQLGHSAGFAPPATDLRAWLQTAPAEDVLVGTLWIVALGLACWVTATTLLYTLARLTRVPSAIRAVEWATLPAIRRMAERAIALSVAASTLVGSGGVAALASEHGSSSGLAPTAVVLNVGDVSPSSAPEHTGLKPPVYVPTLAGDASDPPADQAPPPAEATPPAPASVSLLGIAGGTIDLPQEEVAASAPGPTTYTVQLGDNLWTIAERHVTTATGRQPSEAETARYWSTLVDVNRSEIRSADPDLIFPGERIQCPPVDGATTDHAESTRTAAGTPWQPR